MNNYFSRFPYHKFPKGTASSLSLLKNAMNGRLLLSSHSEIAIDLTNLNKPPEIKDRNWWWNFQQLPTLRWSAIDWLDLTDTELLDKVFNFNSSVIRTWQALPDDLPLKWHDHATAIRLQNLYEWFITIYRFMDAEVKVKNELDMLFLLIIEHLEKLCEDDFYSKHNNHGFEQARITLVLATHLDKLPNAMAVKKLALHRLNDELRFAFTEQGVHKENSPGYHCFMLKQLKHIDRFLKQNAQSIDGLNTEDLISKAEKFLYLISFDNGEIPLIGDTQIKDNQKKIVGEINKRLDKTISKIGFFDYSSSGYLVKNLKTNFGIVQSVFKSGFLSNYHRHDDSLSIHLAVDGVVVLGDAGLYSHNESELARIYTRSVYGHCCFFPISTDVNRNDLDSSVDALFDIRDADTFYALTKVFLGFVLKRRIRFYYKKDDLVLKITDRVVERQSDNKTMLSNYVIPCFFESYHHDENDFCFLFTYEKFVLVIKYPSNLSSIRLLSNSVSISDLSELSFYSATMNKKRAAARLEMMWNSAILNKIEVYFELRGKLDE